MANLSEDIQCAGSDTRPPMLDKTDFAPWQQHIRLYYRGKDSGVNILKSIDERPFQMGTTRVIVAEGTEDYPHCNGLQPKTSGIGKHSMSSRVSNKDVQLGERRKQKPFLSLMGLAMAYMQKVPLQWVTNGIANKSLHGKATSFNGQKHQRIDINCKMGGPHIHLKHDQASVFMAMMSVHISSGLRSSSNEFLIITVLKSEFNDTAMYRKIKSWFQKKLFLSNQDSYILDKSWNHYFSYPSALTEDIQSTSRWGWIPIPDTYARLRLTLRHGNNVFDYIVGDEKDMYMQTSGGNKIYFKVLPKRLSTSLINHYTDEKDIWDNVKKLFG
ncbi:hypothetical protein Tco_0480572 [Tanacetum coccineum]